MFLFLPPPHNLFYFFSYVQMLTKATLVKNEFCGHALIQWFEIIAIYPKQSPPTQKLIHFLRGYQTFMFRLIGTARCSSATQW